METPYREYIKRYNKSHKFTYRPKEYYKNPKEWDLSVVLCSVANLDLLQFSFGADIVEREMRKDENLLVDRAVIWDMRMLRTFKANKGIYTEKFVKSFDLIMVSAYIAF
jgi:hypothetical protein